MTTEDPKTMSPEERKLMFLRMATEFLSYQPEVNGVRVVTAENLATWMQDAEYRSQDQDRFEALEHNYEIAKLEADFVKWGNVFDFMPDSMLETLKNIRKCSELMLEGKGKDPATIDLEERVTKELGAWHPAVMGLKSDRRRHMFQQAAARSKNIRQDPENQRIRDEVLSKLTAEEIETLRRIGFGEPKKDST